jgi:hypothetical protein
MQVEDSQKRIIVSEEVDLIEFPKRIHGLLVERADVRKVVVAPLPREGDVLEHNGLKFEVVRVLNRKRYMIKLVEAAPV